MEVVMGVDKQGRITGIDLRSPIHSGHSVCNECGKDMPGCWDVVCSNCSKTFCYDHAISGLKYWYCKKCSGLFRLIK